jgi:hypothetical protein
MKVGTPRFFWCLVLGSHSAPLQDSEHAESLPAKVRIPPPCCIVVKTKIR